MVKDISDWPYSNYTEWIGKGTGKLVDQDFISEYFPESSKYMAFVLEYHPPEKFDEEFAEILGKQVRRICCRS